MAVEIERKFLLKRTDFLKKIKGTAVTQAYFSVKNKSTIRIRIHGKKGFITIKGKAKGTVREEYEYEIPLDDAREMILHLCEKPAIEKVRHKIKHRGFTWEVDVFKGENEGLIVAEIELEHPDQKFPKPAWLGKEVTDDKRYRNSRLVINPYMNWKE
jgi:adenylate cyclase